MEASGRVVANLLVSSDCYRRMKKKPTVEVNYLYVPPVLQIKEKAGYST